MSPEVEQLIEFIREEGRATRAAIGRASEIIAEALNNPMLSIEDLESDDADAGPQGEWTVN